MRLSSFFKIENKAKHIIIYFKNIIKFSINKKYLPIRRKYITDFFEHKVSENSILLIEPNDCHHETLPGYYNYLRKLGYEVEIAVLKNGDKCFSRFFQKPTIWIFTEKEMKFILSDERIKKYQRIIFNSKVTYKVNTHAEIDIEQFFPKLTNGKQKNIYVQHHIDRRNSNSEIILANPTNDSGLKKFIVNPHYFGIVNITQKNSDETNFILVGDINRKRNTILLEQVLNQLAEKKEKFKVTIIGYGNIKTVSDSAKKHLHILGRVDYEKMYQEIEKADFFLPLLDPDMPSHKRYLRDGTSGTFQLVYGFLKPCIIHKTFANIYGFSNKNSIVYENNEMLYYAMLNAINMNAQNYLKIQTGLKATVKKIEKKSLKNLACIMNLRS